MCSTSTSNIFASIGAAKKGAGRAARFVALTVPAEDVAVTRQHLSFHEERETATGRVT
jgi:hypothetical protein